MGRVIGAAYKYLYQNSEKKSPRIVGMSMFQLFRRVFGDLLSRGIMLVAISCLPEPKPCVTNTVLSQYSSTRVPVLGYPSGAIV